MSNKSAARRSPLAAAPDLVASTPHPHPHRTTVAIFSSSVHTVMSDLRACLLLGLVLTCFFVTTAAADADADADADAAATAADQRFLLDAVKQCERANLSAALAPCACVKMCAQMEGQQPAPGVGTSCLELSGDRRCKLSTVRALCIQEKAPECRTRCVCRLRSVNGTSGETRTELIPCSEWCGSDVDCSPVSGLMTCLSLTYISLSIAGLLICLCALWLVVGKQKERRAKKALERHLEFCCNFPQYRLPGMSVSLQPNPRLASYLRGGKYRVSEGVHSKTFQV